MQELPTVAFQPPKFAGLGTSALRDGCIPLFTELDVSILPTRPMTINLQYSVPRGEEVGWETKLDQAYFDQAIAVQTAVAPSR